MAPSIVEPTTTKLDLERLVRELPKYKPWMSAASWEKWESFIDKIDELDAVKEIPWEISKLIASSSSQRVQEETNNAEPLDSETLRLIAKETSAPRKVHVCVLCSVFVCDVDVHNFLHVHV